MAKWLGGGHEFEPSQVKPGVRSISLSYLIQTYHIEFEILSFCMTHIVLPDIKSDDLIFLIKVENLNKGEREVDGHHVTDLLHGSGQAVCIVTGSDQEIVDETYLF